MGIMKKMIIVICFIMVNLNAHSQVQIQDSIQTVPDTLMKLESERKTFGDRIGKFLGINKEEEIEKLNNKIKAQKNVIDSISVALSTKPSTVIKTVKVNVPSISEEESKSIKRDEKFLNSLPKKYSNIDKKDIKKLAKEIDAKIEELLRQRDSLVKNGSSQESIHAKDNMILSLEREKNVINLSETTIDLENQKTILERRKEELKKYLGITGIFMFILILAIAIILQRKRIKVQDVEIEKQIEDINKKNTYLEYAARIIRHDMHSGINTYIPRGLSSLQKRIQPDKVEELKIGAPIRMIQEGLAHTQKVYKNVYEFTNLVKVKVDFKKESIDLKESLEKYLSGTSYFSQVSIEDLGVIDANEQLICNAIDNLIKNGLKYNNSEKKNVKIYKSEETIIIEDNGTGLSSKKFNELIKKGVDIESETGLGIGITKAIVEEHGFKISCEETISGTKMKIKIG